MASMSTTDHGEAFIDVDEQRNALFTLDTPRCPGQGCLTSTSGTASRC
jgi:hypothetical protein